MKNLELLIKAEVDKVETIIKKLKEYGIKNNFEISEYIGMSEVVFDQHLNGNVKSIKTIQLTSVKLEHLLDKLSKNQTFVELSESENEKIKIKQIISELSDDFGLSKQKDIADKINIGEETLSKHISETFIVKKSETLKNTRNKLELLLTKLKSGEPIDTFTKVLLQDFFVSTIFSRSNLWLILIYIAILGLPFLFASQPFEGKRILEETTSGNLEAYQLSCWLNLMISGIALVVNLKKKITYNSIINLDTLQGVKGFSAYWCSMWLSWLLLYCTQLLLFSRFFDELILWAISDLINLINSFIILNIFIILYIPENRINTKYLFILTIGILGVIVVFDRLNGWFKGSSVEIINYISGIAVLLLFGRLSSLFIKIPYKIAILIYLNFYALLQLKWGGVEMTYWVVVSLFVAKVFLWYYIDKAFLYGEKLELYLQKAYEELQV